MPETTSCSMARLMPRQAASRLLPHAAPMAAATEELARRGHTSACKHGVQIMARRVCPDAAAVGGGIRFHAAPMMDCPWTDRAGVRRSTPKGAGFLACLDRLGGSISSFAIFRCTK